MENDKKQPRCPECGLEYVLRIPREGVCQRLLSIFYYYPFRCQLCFHCFSAFNFGVRYRKQAIDRRQYYRFPVKIQGELRSGDRWGSGMVKVLSVKGCEIDTDLEIARGTIFELTLRIWEDKPGVVVRAARVCNVRTGTLGIQFLQLGHESKARLVWFIQGLILNRWPSLDRLGELSA